MGKNWKVYTLSLVAAVLAGIFATGLTYASGVPDTETAANISPLPRPSHEFIPPAMDVSISQIVPDNSNGVKISALTDKPTYNRGDIAKIHFAITNTGLKPFTATTVEIEYQIIAKDGGPGYTVLSNIMYPAENPLTILPGMTDTINLAWPVKVSPDKGVYSDASPGQYIVRTIMYSPYEMGSETSVEVTE